MTQHLMTEASVNSQIDAVRHANFVITCTVTSHGAPV